LFVLSRPENSGDEASVVRSSVSEIRICISAIACFDLASGKLGTRGKTVKGIDVVSEC